METGNIADSFQYENLQRAPRRHFNGYQNDRTDPRDEARGQQAQVRKVTQDLENERKIHKIALEKAEIRARENCEAAVREIMNDVLNKQIRVVQQTVNLKRQDLELEARKELTRKIENLLAIGQKQFVGADDQSLSTFVDVNEEIIRERVATEMKRRDRKTEAQFIIQAKELEFREAALEVREKAISAMLKDAQVRENLKETIRGELEEEITKRVGNAEYDRGYSDGKAVGQTEGNEQLRRACYMEGYADCHESTDQMNKLRAGLLAVDNPDVAYLFDAAHPKNPFTLGVQIGKRQLATSSQQPQLETEADTHTLLKGPSAPTRTNGSVVTPPVGAPKPHPYAHIT